MRRTVSGPQRATGGTVSADEVRGPRHAAPKKPLFTRFHVPSGKAIALAAMPTAVLMGMGFTPTLALADGNDGAPPANSLTADEYQACLEIVEGADKDDATASPTPSATASGSASPEEDASPEPGTSASPGAGQGTPPSSDSGSDDEDEPAPTPSATGGGQESDEQADPEPEPQPSETDRDLLEDVGDALQDVLTPGEKETAASPTPSASASAGEETGEDAADAVEETTEKVTDTVEDTVKDTGDKASEAAGDTGETVEEVTEEATEAPGATASPSPSGTSTADPEDCPVATDAEGGVDNRILLPDDPWFLNASSLTLKGADYQGIVEVRTASGATKRVLKYVVSDGTDIGDLHQTVKDRQSGKTHHVQAAEGSMSTIRDGDTVMYTEKISGKLLGLIPVTFDPEHPPPLNIPLIYFTDVTVQQAGQFGGTLHIPGLQQYVTG
ncbi:hypothetical protein GCM10017779_09040 [Streptomyces capillispiralis]|uniref:Membrane-bound hydrophilic protein n=1 Tax=Streptomyces capillispiralis TaxID=68182 RepID=A0A561TDH3_9ACTN|nr:hypothetical protein FHX78_112094 [Streptomyces capillispiralis]GHH90447.1 hypothetical protein GCM10017779_09040 [Streptomyces capillispiralis]